MTLGTSLQIRPAEYLPFSSKQPGCAVAICNLQATTYDKRATLVLRGYVDEVVHIV